MFEQIKQLKWSEIGVGIYLFLGALAPGFLLLFIYKPELIVQLEFLKLTVFSLALTLPLVVLNMFLTGIVWGQDKFRVATTALVLTFYAYYPALLLSYLFTLSFKYFLIALAVAQLFAIVLLFFETRKEANNAAKT